MAFEDDLVLRANDKKLASAFLDFEAARRSVLEALSGPGGICTIADGVIRRVATRDPAELVLAVFFHNRRVWRAAYATRSERNRYHDWLWRELLQALVVGDIEFVEHLVGRLPSEGTLNYRECDQLIYEVVYALLSCDDLDRQREGIRAKIRDRNKRSYIAFQRSIVEGLDAICANDSTAVAESIGRTGAAMRRTHCGEEGKFVCLEGHGLWALAHRIDPALVADFDTSSPLPWDRGLHAFTRTLRDPRTLFDAGELNDEVRALLTLE